MSGPCFSIDLPNEVPAYDHNDGTVSVHSINTSLYNVLSAICESANIRLIMEDDLSMTDSISFNELPLDQAIRRLVGNKGLLIIYQIPESDNIGKIKEIRVYNNPVITQAEETISSHIQEKIEWINYLATQAKDEALAELERMLLIKENNLTITRHVIDTLSNITDDRISSILAKGLSDNRPQVRNNIVHALGQQDDLNSSLILAQVLYGDPDKTTRLQAIEQLGLYNSPTAKVFLLPMLKDKDMDIQVEAEFFLDSFKALPPN